MRPCPNWVLQCFGAKSWAPPPAQGRNVLSLVLSGDGVTQLLFQAAKKGGSNLETLEIVVIFWESLGVKTQV